MRFRFQRSSFHVVADGAVPLDPDVFAQARDAPLIFLYVLGGGLSREFQEPYCIHHDSWMQLLARESLERAACSAAFLS